MNRSGFFLFLFIGVSLAQLLALIIGWPMVHLVTKPLIMLSLTGYYWINAERRSLTFILALLFCWLGDVLLMFESTAALFFIFGLLSFLMGHLLYMISYRKLRDDDISHELLWTQKVRFSIPIVLIGTGLITVLFPTLGILKIPVLIYSMVLVGMVMTALFRYGRTSLLSFWLVFAGAAFFMISDSLLAINKFYAPLPFGGFMIMLTYIGAQYLIVQGGLRHRNAC
ncbi:lysoplasmalogenase [soil metagenome]